MSRKRRNPERSKALKLQRKAEDERRIAAIEEAKHNAPWFATAADLKLTYVPEEHKESVRQFVAPYLSQIPLQPGKCWRVAQDLMVAANSPRVGYVEGVYDNIRDGCNCAGCDCGGIQTSAAPHAWNTVDGFVVDLSIEDRHQRHGWVPEEWLHEPMKEYSLAVFRKYHQDSYDGLDGFSITGSNCLLHPIRGFLR